MTEKTQASVPCVDCAVMPIINPKKTAFLGYEFVATDMQSSSSYEDLCDE